MAIEPQKTAKDLKDWVKKETSKQLYNPARTKAYRNVLIILIILIILGIIGYFVSRKRSSVNETQNTAEQIRQTFDVPTTTAPFATSPTYGPGLSGGPSSSLPATTSPVTSSPDIEPITPRGPSWTSYKNSGLGFELSMPMNWAADDSQYPGRVIFYDRSTGQMSGYAEIYENASGENLDTLAKILQDSPSVSAVSRTTVAGQPALNYASGSGTGVAMIFNNKIYYLHGSLVSPDSLSKFKFTSPS